ncbi:MAG: hypothetical protein H6812_04485 [Phycisphaeraceae bacterium]|nr:hypothetical protein [Phycisphaerales bacterium]MCB9842495.1 hypothetical protein [Phycisphaeraceae bacterium]
MRVWPSPTINDRLDAMPRWAVGFMGAAAAFIAGWWALRPISIDPVDGSLDKSNFYTTADGGQPQRAPHASIDIPATALAASLYDELFPQAPSPEPEAPPPPSPPKLDVVLIAITPLNADSLPTGTETNEADAPYSAFVRVVSTGEYLTLRTGDRTPTGAVVRAVYATGVLFDIRGRETRLEITSPTISSSMTAVNTSHRAAP